MQVVVDTSVWSLALRRRRTDLSDDEREMTELLRELIIDGRAVIVGVVRQELLTGLADPQGFDDLRDYLAYFDDPPVNGDDFVRAAEFGNRCLAAGVAAPVPDMLICSIAAREGWPILTLDGDFTRYAAHLPIRLHPQP